MRRGQLPLLARDGWHFGAVSGQGGSGCVVAVYVETGGPGGRSEGGARPRESRAAAAAPCASWGGGPSAGDGPERASIDPFDLMPRPTTALAVRVGSWINEKLNADLAHVRLAVRSSGVHFTLPRRKYMIPPITCAKSTILRASYGNPGRCLIFLLVALAFAALSLARFSLGACVWL